MNRTVVYDSNQFLVLYAEPQKGQLGGVRRTTVMDVKFALRATGAALAIAFAAPIVSRERGRRNACFERMISHIPGKSLIAVIVDYAPGDAFLQHAHEESAFIFAYVVSGAIESQADDQRRRIYHAGESWYARADSNYGVSRNASQTKPATLLVVFVVDTDDEPDFSGAIAPNV
jgi:quercetin dioxygenase-like cupin family protein